MLTNRLAQVFYTFDNDPDRKEILEELAKDISSDLKKAKLIVPKQIDSGKEFEAIAKYRIELHEDLAEKPSVKQITDFLDYWIRENQDFAGEKIEDKSGVSEEIKESLVLAFVDRLSEIDILEQDKNDQYLYTRFFANNDLNLNALIAYSKTNPFAEVEVDRNKMFKTDLFTLQKYIEPLSHRKKPERLDLLTLLEARVDSKLKAALLEELAKNFHKNYSAVKIQGEAIATETDAEKSKKPELDFIKRQLSALFNQVNYENEMQTLLEESKKSPELLACHKLSVEIMLRKLLEQPYGIFVNNLDGTMCLGNTIKIVNNLGQDLFFYHIPGHNYCGSSHTSTLFEDAHRAFKDFHTDEPGFEVI